MPEPFRLRVLKGLGEVIKTVTPANGFQYDLSDYQDEGGTTRERVYRGRNLFGPNYPLPLVSILEDPRALDQVNGPGGDSSSTGAWQLILQGFVDDDRAHPTDPAYVLGAEVVRVLALARKQQRNLLDLGAKSPCVTEMTIGQPVVRPADDVLSDTAFFYLPLTLTLVEEHDNPFA